MADEATKHVLVVLGSSSDGNAEMQDCRQVEAPNISRESHNRTYSYVCQQLKSEMLPRGDGFQQEDVSNIQIIEHE